MLKELYIENLAVIEKASILFSDKLNVFSGETGAGKSILIGGINAILGGRASKDLVRNGAKKAVITALFTDIPDKVSILAEEYGYSHSENELILMREITHDGKSTARVNGKAATALILREIASLLIDIHGQHDTRLIMNVDNQRDVLDFYGGYSDKLSEYELCFKEFQNISRKIKKSEADNELKEQRIEILKSKINEIDSFKFYRGEEDDAVKELKILQNTEAIERTLNGVYYTLSGNYEQDDLSVIDRIRKCGSDLETLFDMIPPCQELSERLYSAVIELDDIKTELLPLIPSGNDKAALSALEERVSDMRRIKRKYGMTIDEIVEQNEKWKEELSSLEYSDDIRHGLLLQKKKLGDSVKKLGTEITEMRKKAADMLTTAITKELAYLNMPDICFKIDISQDKVTINGMDRVEMLISANKGEEPKPIGRIASGGELSRIMLAVKSVLSDNYNVPTMIFDEIDSGISGRAAQKVGIKLREISRKRQVLCVTHLAQIASMADKHLMIEKTNEDGRTYTKIADLDNEGRKRELARIISGDSDSVISIRGAEELLNIAESIDGAK